MRACNCARASPLQSRTCEGCDTMTSQFCRHFVRVSIHAPAWGTTLRQTSGQRLDSCFNPRTRVGCDGLSVRCRICYEVSIHAPAWGATPAPDWSGCHNTVSIHAPAWGATKGERHEQGNQPVSIHAPAWGATDIFGSCFVSQLMFQSTHPRGVRHSHFRRAGLLHPVSIHAPAWGATCCLALASEGWKRTFQFTHPRGVRRNACWTLPAGKIWFQSTHPRGVRRQKPFEVFAKGLVSIHAPAWGATCALWPSATSSGSFNPRTRVGCDLAEHAAARKCELFQSTHPRGVRHGILIGLGHIALVSIHAPAWGATPAMPVNFSARKSFNPRTRVGCDRR